MEPNNIDILVLNNPNGLGLCLSRLLGKDPRLTVEFKEFTPQLKLFFTPVYTIYLMSSFSLEIENIKFLQKKYPNTTIIPVAKNYDYYEMSTLCCLNIFYPITYDVHVPTLINFLLNISDKSFRPFNLIKNGHNVIVLSELQKVLEKYYGQQKIDYTDAYILYQYLVLHKSLRSLTFTSGRKQTYLSSMFRKMSAYMKEIGTDINIDVDKIGDFDVDKYVNIKELPDSGKDYNYLIPKVYAPEKLRNLKWKQKRLL